MLAKNICLALLGFSAGITAAGGLFSFIIGLGVISDFADRTHTGEQVMALTEMLDLFPIFIRRIRMVRGIAAVMIGIAFGKGLGALLFFWKRW